MDGSVANARVHGTTGVAVSTRYAEEQPLLGSVAGRSPYATAYHALRRVGRDGRLSYRGQLYQVPLEQALRTVQVDEQLDGTRTFRAADGQIVPARVVTDPGLPAPAPRLRPAARVPTRREAPALGNRRGLPVVQVRELAVYEEVAHAARGA